jgi:hypothetical protein
VLGLSRVKAKRTRWTYWIDFITFKSSDVRFLLDEELCDFHHMFYVEAKPFTRLSLMRETSIESGQIIDAGSDW